MDSGLLEPSELVEKQRLKIKFVLAEIDKVIVGQKYLIERLLIGLLAKGHILIEGVPGLAKTTAVKVLSKAIDTGFSRIQFTPDLLPSDLVGTMVYQAQTGTFEVKKGPVFSNIVLADEINRAPAKVQSALLEAMEERNVTIGGNTFNLDEPFLVMATQNPIDQEGTYPLPEAQADRFMMKLAVGYPSVDEEGEIVKRALGKVTVNEVKSVLSLSDIFKLREVVEDIYIDDRIRDYILRLVQATRYPEKFGLSEMSRYIQFGVSPRGTISLSLAARALAFLKGKSFVSPTEVKTMAADIFRHRIILSYEAEAENLSTDDIISGILQRIEVP